MPSSEDCIEARKQVWDWARQQLLAEGHPLASALVILQHMSYENQVEKAEKFLGEKIYRGAYSPF